MPILFALLVPAAPSSASAETRITGEADAVELDTNEASVEEALIALGEVFDLNYRTATGLDRQISGTYAGSLRQVVTRLLKGYDFVIETSPSGISVAVYGSSNANANNFRFGAPPEAPTFGLASAPSRPTLRPGRGGKKFAPGRNAAIFRAHQRRKE